MFLATRAGVALVDAPSTIGHNLLRAIGEVTRARGLPSEVTHLVCSCSNDWRATGRSLTAAYDRVAVHPAGPGESTTLRAVAAE